MSHDHDAGHDPAPEPYAALRTRALESLLIDKGLLSSDVVDALVSAYEQDIGPLNGARVVARAWSDPAYKERLLRDSAAAIAELGFKGDRVVVLENTPSVRNVVVCTLCSCYPWSVLGLPPSWYKLPAYRARVVSEPRQVLREFGLHVADSVEIRVWDSSAELRYMVLPECPEGAAGLPEGELAALVTRDSMIGVADARPLVAAG